MNNSANIDSKKDLNVTILYYIILYYIILYFYSYWKFVIKKKINEWILILEKHVAALCLGWDEFIWWVWIYTIFFKIIQRLWIYIN